MTNQIRLNDEILIVQVLDILFAELGVGRIVNFIAMVNSVHIIAFVFSG